MKIRLFQFNIISPRFMFLLKSTAYRLKTCVACHTWAQFIDLIKTLTKNGFAQTDPSEPVCLRTVFSFWAARTCSDLVMLRLVFMEELTVPWCLCIIYKIPYISAGMKFKSPMIPIENSQQNVVDHDNKVNFLGSYMKLDISAGTNSFLVGHFCRDYLNFHFCMLSPQKRLL